MIINTAFIHVKKIRLIFEFLHILVGIILSFYNKIIPFNVLLYVGLIVSFGEQIVAFFCLKRYIASTNMTFRDIYEFQTWEKSYLTIIEGILFYFKITIYLVISILTIIFFSEIDNVPLKIYLLQIIFQVLLTFALRFFQISSNPLVHDEIGNTRSSLENNTYQWENNAYQWENNTYQWENNAYQLESVQNQPVYENKIEVHPNEECSICMDKNDLIWLSLPCEHKFHEECIFKWIETNLSCPICRKQLGNNA